MSNETSLKNRIVASEFVIGVDLGINNLMAITSNKTGFTPILVNGRPLKSQNQYFNKRRSELLDQLPDGQSSSKRLVNIDQKNINHRKNYFHNSSKLLIDMLIDEGIGTLIIGKYANSNRDNQDNQTFLHIPYDELFHMIKNKASRASIQMIITDENYTSKCSFLDNEPVQYHETYVGERIERGLFRASDGRLINADVNASYNIIRKAIPNAFPNGIEDAIISPKKVLPV